jgi:hypothetical protein
VLLSYACASRGIQIVGSVVVEQGYSLSGLLSHFGAGRMRAVSLRTAGVSLRLR